jgi:hypothetical protein
MILYRVIYLWRGERHVAESTRDRLLARSVVRSLRGAGYRAWVESEV